MGQLYLAVSDGTTTCTIADGSGGATSYRLKYGGWAPEVAPLRKSTLGGRGPYAEVMETLTLNIHGSSAADAYSKLQTLNTLLDQAERQARGEPVTAVVLKYSPDSATVSSAASPLQARVLGRAADAEATMTIGPRLHAMTGVYVIEGVIVRIWRMGEWLHTSETASSAATNSGEVASITMANALTIPGPTAIGVNGMYQPLSPATYSDAFVILASRIEVIKAWQGQTATDFASYNDTANFAIGNGLVARFTPTATTERALNELSYAYANGAVAVWANLRNNSATTTFRVRLRHVLSASSTYMQVYGYTPAVTIPVSSGPKWYFLGIIPAADNLVRFNVLYTASAASGTLDTDTLVIASADPPNFAALSVMQPHMGLVDIDPKALTDAVPYVGDHAAVRHYSYAGDAFVTSKATAMKAIVLITGSDTATIPWRATTGSNTILVSNTWSLTRQTAYLAPQ